MENRPPPGMLGGHPQPRSMNSIPAASAAMLQQVLDPALSSPAITPSTNLDRQLNVTDALSYLDNVKTQFANQPDVYNQFLDIMKDFKSQAIDTPGVINRVSVLFHGNAQLVAGFNTFLPTGYRIDISTEYPNTIKVTSPSGTVLHPAGGPITMPPAGFHAPAPFPTPPVPVSQPPPPPVIRPGPDQALPPMRPSHLDGPAMDALPPHPNGFHDPQSDMPQAIDFLSRVRARFLHRKPEVYNEFVELIQAIPKGEQHQNMAQIQAHGQKMLKDDPDLMAEFLMFLPGQSGYPAHRPDLLPHDVPEAPWPKNEDRPSSKKVAQPLKRKKRAAEKETASVTGSRGTPAKKPKHHHRPEPPSPPRSPYLQPQSPSLSHVPPPTHQLTAQTLAAFQQQQQQSPYGAVMFQPPSNQPNPKLRFFDHARRRLSDPAAYEDFLKLLMLFTQDIIDMPTLVDHAAVFLGDEDLLSQFKDVLDWDESRNGVFNIPPGSIRTGPPEALNATPVDDGQGPSYRRLPDSEIKLACSGRDQLCRSVLNDEWVSHPTWASEEAGFMTHKKNAFEDALHKSEEERHEYHVHLQALSATIAILEPIWLRFDGMSQEELTLFRLEADFGGPSKALYHRTLKKIYGNDTGREIIAALQDSPAVAIPVVLLRLKQKDEEWRRALREWSRTWREVESKNFYKSLDHQGITFKISDKKAITSKHFVQQIQTLRKEQTKGLTSTVPSFVRGNLGYQLKYPIEDLDVLHDSLRMVYTFLDHSHAQYSPQERRSVEGFLRNFVPLFFGQPAAEFNAACGLDPEDANDKEEEDDEDLHTILLRIARRRYRSKHKEQTTNASTSASRAQTPDDDDEATDMMQLDDPDSLPIDVWIRTSVSDHLELPNDSDQSDRPFFANTTFYTLIRLLQTLYDRLYECKQIGIRLAADKHSSLLVNPIAEELGLNDPNGGPGALLAQSLEAIKKAHQHNPGGPGEPNVVYIYLLEACEKLFDSELDAATFEEHMRWFFGKSAYQLFTLDKLIMALVKQVQSVLADNRSLDIWSLLQAAHQSKTIGVQDMVRYRREAERHVGADDHLYRIQWAQKGRTLRIQLMGDEDASIDGEVGRISRWRQYSSTYAMDHPTEWMPSSRKENGVFLRRTRRLRKEEGTYSDERTHIRFSLPAYKLLYEAGSENMLVRNIPKEEMERARTREDERRRCPMLGP